MPDTGLTETGTWDSRVDDVRLAVLVDARLIDYWHIAAGCLHRARLAGDQRLVDFNHDECDAWLDEWRARHPLPTAHSGA
jgi:hypothetical protein